MIPRLEGHYLYYSYYINYTIAYRKIRLKIDKATY